MKLCYEESIEIESRRLLTYDNTLAMKLNA